MDLPENLRRSLAGLELELAGLPQRERTATIAMYRIFFAFVKKYPRGGLLLVTAIQELGNAADNYLKTEAAGHELPPIP